MAIKSWPVKYDGAVGLRRSAAGGLEAVLGIRVILGRIRAHASGME
jgi:hypothetical protein